MRRIIITILIAFLGSPLFGNDWKNSGHLASAINYHLRPIVSNIASSPNVGGWEWETNGNGGYLLCMSMDVTGDGNPELFVSSTLGSNKDILTWSVFNISPNGALKPYNEKISFPRMMSTTDRHEASLVYVAAPDREKLSLGDEQSYPVVRFAFSFPRITQSVIYTNEEEANTISSDDNETSPGIESILLADYLTDPDAMWNSGAEWIMDASDCWFHDGDKERALQNVEFTPQMALSLLKVTDRRSPRPGFNDREEKRQTLNEDVFFGNPSRTKENQKTNNLWILIGFIMVISAGFGTLLIKRGKRTSR